MTRKSPGDAFKPAHARRSESLHPPASGVCRAVPHAVPLGLLAAFILIAAHSYRTLARPMTDRMSPPPPSAPLIFSSDRSNPIAAWFSPSVQRWSHSISAWANQSGLPANLIATVIQIESCGHPLITSRAGALGLMQVMPYHFDPHQDPLDPEHNGAVGVEYLKGAHLLSGGDISLTLAGYNGGHAIISRPPRTWPSETQRYVRWGSGIYADAGAGLESSPTLDAWLTAGGRALCQQAEEVAVVP